VKRIAVYPNTSKPHCARELERLTGWLHRRDCTVRVIQQTAEGIASPEATRQSRSLLQEVELLIVLGGDGTLLSAARMAYPKRVPILGVNFGGLGFLTDVSVDNMIPALERVLAGDYRSESRMLLRASVVDPAGKERQKVYGMNDLVLHEDGRRAILIDTTLQGTPLGLIRADGMIVATPTGSTAYSLSAGGPIVNPTLNVLIATPISPHSLSVRPLLFPASESIEFRIRPPELRVDLTVDGQIPLDFRAHDTIRVRRAEKTMEFILVENRSFYAVLRNKLGWGRGG
jgi:NAD+ kinase